MDPAPCASRFPPDPPTRLPATFGAKDTSICYDFCIKQSWKRPPSGSLAAHFLLILPHPYEVQSLQKRSCLKLKCAVFLKGREMSHRKYYKKGLSLSAVHTLLRPHALYSGNAVEPTSSLSRQSWGQASWAREEAAEEGKEALGALLLLKSPLRGSRAGGFLTTAPPGKSPQSIF